jgi:hypothetical protein
MAEYAGVANLMDRSNQAKFTGNKVGQTVQVMVEPNAGTAKEMTGSTSASDATVNTMDLTIEHWFYDRCDLTSKELTFELPDLAKYVIAPKVRGIMTAINKYAIQKLQVFRQNIAGTVTSRPSTAAHIAAAHKVLRDNKIEKSGRVGIVDTTVESSFVQLEQFADTAFGMDNSATLREMALGYKFGTAWFSDPDMGAFVRSSAANVIAGTTVMDGDAAIGATTIHMDGNTADGTVYAGTCLVITGDTTRYVLTKDATISGNEGDLEISPPLVVAAHDGDAITFEAAGFENLIFQPKATNLVVVGGAPLWGLDSVVQNFNGYEIRVSRGGSMTNLANSICFDCFVAARVDPRAGVLLCG